MRPAELSRALRQGRGTFLRRRRAVVGLSLVTIGSMAMVSLYQMGMIKHLPEPALPYLNADKVDASDEAYEKPATPDGLLGLANFGVTAVLAGMGPPERAETQPWIPLALAAKVAVDTVQSGRLTVDQWVRHRAFCSWCLLASAATFAQVPLVIPETRAALRHLWQGRRGIQQIIKG
ncbi:MAG: vitamin K epoxide reductase family protein [Chloroflexaceae bacterium]